MDILPDGSLDYDDEVLAQLDYVIAAIHQSFNQSEEEIMKRLENACRTICSTHCTSNRTYYWSTRRLQTEYRKINAFSRKQIR